MTTEARDYRDQFMQLLDEQYPITPNTTAEEDINELLESGKRIPRYLAISHNDQIFYYYLHDDPDEAGFRAAEHAADDIYAEAPVALIDMATGKKWHPRVTTTWEPAD